MTINKESSQSNISYKVCGLKNTEWNKLLIRIKYRKIRYHLIRLYYYLALTENYVQDESKNYNKDSSECKP